MTLNDFSQAVATYLCAKLPDINIATLSEIAEYLTAKAHNYAQDEIQAAYQKWFEGQKKANDLFLKYIETRI